MKFKNRIAPILCTAVMAVSLMHPFSGKVIYAEGSAAALMEETAREERQAAENAGSEKPGAAGAGQAGSGSRQSGETDVSGTENTETDETGRPDRGAAEEAGAGKKKSGAEMAEDKAGKGEDRAEGTEDGAGKGEDKAEGTEDETGKGEGKAEETEDEAGKGEGKAEGTEDEAGKGEGKAEGTEDEAGREEGKAGKGEQGTSGDTEMDGAPPDTEESGLSGIDEVSGTETENPPDTADEPGITETQEWEVQQPVVRTGQFKSRRALPERMQEGQSGTYYGTGSVQIVEIPVPGIYRIEAAGNASGVGGSCTKGSISLKKGQKLYLYVANGQYNGTTSSGGSGGTTMGDDRETHTMAAGGAATDIRLDGTGLSDRIMVAGGGGGSGYSNCAGAQATKAESGNGNASGTGSGSTTASTDKRRSLSGGGGGGYYGGKIATDNSEVYYPKANAHIGTSYLCPAFTDTSHSVGTNGGSGYCKITLERISLSLELTAPSGWTNGDVTITAKVKEQGEGLPDRYLSWERDEEGNDIWTDETTYTVSENGTYICKIRDVEGTQTEWPIEISQIDKLPPEASLAADTEKWTDADITLQITAEDAPETDRYGKSGLQEKACLWGYVDAEGRTVWETESDPGGEDADGEKEDTAGEGREAWTEKTSFTVSKNGIYICKVRDRAGNITEVRREVKNIDRTPPRVAYDRPEGWYGGSVRITLEAEDLQPDGTPGCGLAEKPYSRDGITFEGSPEFLIEAEGTYSFWVKDMLGNVKETKLHIFHDVKKDNGNNGGGGKDDSGGGKNDSGGGGKTEPENPAPLPEAEVLENEETASGEETGMTQYSENMETGKKTELRREAELPVPSLLLREPEETGKTEKTEKKIKKLPALEDKKEDEKTVSLKEEHRPEPKRADWKRIALYSVWMAVVLCGLVWLLFCLLFEHVTVYRKDENGKYEKIGRCAILRKKEYKQVNLLHLMKREDRDYKVCFAKIFVLLHKKEKVLLRTCQGVELRNVAKEIEILSCNC